MPHIGTRINVDNIESHLANVRKEMILYEQQNPEAKQELLELFSRVTSENKK